MRRPAQRTRDRVVRAVATLGLALFLLGGMAWYWGVGVARRLTLPTDLQFRSVVRRPPVDDAPDRLGHFRPRHGGRHRIAAEPDAPWLVDARLGERPQRQRRDRRARDADGFVSRGLLNGAFAGIAGLLLANINRLDPGLMTFLVIPAIAAASRSRLSSLPGAFIGGMVYGLLEAVLTAFPAFANLRSAGPYVLALVFMMALGAGQGVGAKE